MKIAIPANGNNAESMIDARFGRSPWFLIFDSETSTWQAIENSPDLQAVQGAGIQSAETIIQNGATALLTPHCGPKAFRVLQAAGIEVYLGVSGKVADALAEFQSGGLTSASAADVEGHW